MKIDRMNEIMRESIPMTNIAAVSGASVAFAEVEKRYGQFVAMHPTSFTIGRGEFFSIIGPSGSGKTTLLGVTAGFVVPSSGKVLIDDRSVVGIKPAKRNTGMVFQHYSLFPHMTVAENVAFPLKMRGVSKPEIARRVKDSLDRVRLGQFADRRPSQLSGGQQQRVALARATVYQPPLLLMDEPLSALDKNLREEMQFEIKQFQRNLGVTVLYVTHDQHEASAMSDRVAIMNAGCVAQIGTPRELYERPSNTFVAGFLGEANLFDVSQISADPAGGLACRCGDNRMTLADSTVPPGEVKLCIRPESLSLVPGSAKVTDRNALAGIVRDTVFSSGALHYRIEVAPFGLVSARTIITASNATIFHPGDSVQACWKPEDCQLVSC